MTAAVAAVVVTVVAVGTVLVANRVQPPATATARAIDQPAAARSSAASTDEPAPISGAPTSKAPTPSQSQRARPVPLHVVSMTPNDEASGTQPIVIAFDAPIGDDSPLPTITPTTPGIWSRPSPTMLRFDPNVPFAPDTAVSVEIPSGMRSANGGKLAKAVENTYRVADGSIERLQQLLAQLGYLPLTFTPVAPEPNTAAAQGAMAFSPPPGTFEFRFPNTPKPLADLWQQGEMTAMTTGAVMAFEKAHDLAVDGDAGPAVWSALLHDAVANAVDPKPYSWAWTTMSRPETLRIWSDGEFVLTSKANTGIAAAPTPKGSWPVYSRFRSQTMQGTNPDGTKYYDPGVPYVSYFYRGDAIHGFKRASYGYPQSLGCVELPYDAAAQVWTLIDYGTVVTVTN